VLLKERQIAQLNIAEQQQLQQMQGEAAAQLATAEKAAAACQQDAEQQIAALTGCSSRCGCWFWADLSDCSPA